VGVERYLLARATVLRLPTFPVLDVGCGDGRLVLALESRVSEPVLGHDLPEVRSRCWANVSSVHSEEEFERRFTFRPAEEGLPHADRSIGLIVSNQVVEHVRDLSRYFSECARVLHPRGRMMCVFPPKSHLIEAHTRVLLLHRLPPGSARRAYIGWYQRTFAVPRQRGDEDVSRFWDRWLEERTFYRSHRQVRAEAVKYFARVESDATHYRDAVFENRWPGRLPGVHRALQVLVNRTLVFSEPRPPQAPLRR
jgi:SAM-dependent methyltransferase